jgi:hypothetical protein
MPPLEVRAAVDGPTAPSSGVRATKSMRKAVATGRYAFKELRAARADLA